jgi:antirestriction protein ArdC
MFCHLFNIQFHLQHWRVLSQAEMTGIRQQKKNKKNQIEYHQRFAKEKKKKEGFNKLAFSCSPILYRTMVYSCLQTVYDSANYV